MRCSLLRAGVDQELRPVVVGNVLYTGHVVRFCETDDHGIVEGGTPRELDRHEEETFSDVILGDAPLPTKEGRCAAIGYARLLPAGGRVGKPTIEFTIRAFVPAVNDDEVRAALQEFLEEEAGQSEEVDEVSTSPFRSDAPSRTAIRDLVGV